MVEKNFYLYNWFCEELLTDMLQPDSMPDNKFNDTCGIIEIVVLYSEEGGADWRLYSNRNGKAKHTGKTLHSIWH